MKQIVPKGFTLIELLVVFAVIGTLILSSLAAFFTFNRSQTFKTSVSNFVYMLNTAKARAQSQVKPSVCGTQVLRGYQITVTASGRTYTLSVRCGANIYAIETKSLGSGVTFVTGSTTPVVFAVSTGTLPATATVTITGHGETKSVIINATGNISVP
jgi:prepilin-type N-terminal cleavage/methylation domain-containing protein